MAPEEIQLPEPAPVEPTPEPVPPVEVPVEPPPEPEALPLRIGDREIPLDAAAVARIAEQMGFDNPAAVLNQLRAGAEAADLYKEARNYYRKARSAPQYEPQPAPQQRDAYGPVPQRQYQPPADDDPIALVRDMHNQMAQLREQQAQLLQFTQQQVEQTLVARQREEQKLVREAQHSYTDFAKELRDRGVPEHRIPEMDYLLEEAEGMGMFQSDLPIAEIYRRTHRMLYADQLAEQQAQRAVQGMRNPKATVTVPGPRPAAPPAPQPNDILSTMSTRDAISLLPRAGS